MVGNALGRRRQMLLVETGFMPVCRNSPTCTDETGDKRKEIREMKVLKIEKEMGGVVFTDEGPLTDVNGDGNLVNLDTGEILTWFVPITETATPYYSYGKFSIAGNIHLALFETKEERRNFEESFELF